jgi:hypothetical protein
MFFDKPDIRYVDMCMYIDDTVYSGDFNQELVYQYLYHIIMMIAVKRNYFDTRSALDDFSLYAASSYYMRLTDERQFGNCQTLPKIRSILNYVRKTLFSLKRDYCKKYISNNEVPCEEFVVSDRDSFSMYVGSRVDPMGRIEVGNYLGSIQPVIKEFLMTIPYKYGTPIWNNIYISCMLSFLNSVTLRNRDLERINNFKRPNTLTDSLLNKLYLQERYQSTILYHLDDSMYNYITVLTNRIRHKIASEVSHSINTYTNSYINMKNLMVSNIQEQGY